MFTVEYIRSVVSTAVIHCSLLTI